MKYKIEDLLEKVIDNRGKTPPTSTTGHMLLEINSLTGDNKYPNYGAVQKIVSKETYNTWFRSGHPQVGDILIPTVGTLDALAYLNRDDCCIAQNIIAFRTKKEICDGNFLYYLLRDKRTRARLLNLNIGGVQPSIKVPHLKQLEVEIPDLETQKKIVRILSALDQKIELNNQELECLTKIGKEMYNDYANNTKDTIKATDKLEFKKGVEPGSKSYKKEKGDGDIRFIRVGDMLSNTPENYVDEQLCLNSILSESDIAMSFDATIGRVSYGISGGYSSGLRKIKSKDKSISNAFIYYWLMSGDIQKVLFENATGTTILHAGKAINYFTLPYDKRIETVSEKLNKVFYKQLQIKRQNVTLEKLRDTLLPKLMSGEINLDEVMINE